MKILSIGLGVFLSFGIAMPLVAQEPSEKVEPKADNEQAKESIDHKVARIVEQLDSESKDAREKAERQLSELDTDAIEALKREAKLAKKDGNADLAASLRDAIKRLEQPANNEQPDGTMDGAPVFNFEMVNGGLRRETIEEDGTVKVIYKKRNKDGQWTTMTQKKGSEKIEVGHSKTLGGKLRDKVEYKDAAEFKEKDKELYEIWNFKSGDKSAFGPQHGDEDQSSETPEDAADTPEDDQSRGGNGEKEDSAQESEKKTDQPAPEEKGNQPEQDF